MAFLSIITITYNDLIGLCKTINSIEQCFSFRSHKKQIEHIIIDGNSVDGTKDFLRTSGIYRKIQNRYISEPDRGIYDAMNKGVIASTGDFIVFLNSGDEIFSGIDTVNLISILNSCAMTADEAGLAFSAFIQFARKGFKVTSRNIEEKFPCMPTIHQSMFFKRDILLNFPLDVSYRICGDYDNFARIYSNGFKFRVCDDIFSVFYAGGISSKSPIKLFLESSAITKKYFLPNYYRRTLIKLKLLNSLLVFQLLLLVFGVRR